MKLIDNIDQDTLEELIHKVRRLTQLGRQQEVISVWSKDWIIELKRKDKTKLYYHNDNLEVTK